MELYSALFILFIVAFIAGTSWVDRLRERKQRRTRDSGALAERWGGRAVSSTFTEGFRLTLEAEGIPGEVTFSQTGPTQDGLTRIHFKAPSKHRLRVTSETFDSWLRRMFGTKDIKTGESRFDGAFWIESTDADWAREILDEPLRRSFFGLQQVYGPTVSVDVTASGLSLRVGRILVDEPGLLGHLVEQAVGALQRVHSRAGMDLLVVELGEGQCPVCNHPVEEGRRCPACATPHHAECWKYMGGCAIFGCRGRAA